MIDGDTLILILLAFCFILGFGLSAYFDWASKHLDKAPEWIRKELTRSKNKK